MCYVSRPADDREARAKELPAAQWIDLARQAARMGTLSLVITGGEAVLHPGFREIYEAIARMGFRITLFSNGTLLHPGLVDWLSKIPPATLDVTLYGASEETYARVTGSREAFHQAMRGIELALSRRINTRIKTTIIRKNVHDFDAIKKIASDFGVEFSYSLLLHQARQECGRCIEDERLSAAEIEGFGSTGLALADGECGLPSPQEMADRYRDVEPLFCAAAKSGFWISWNGDMSPCTLFTSPSVRPSEIGFANACEELGNFVQKVRAPSECRHCEHRPFCPVCPGRLWTETGSCTGHSDYICDLAGVKHREYQLLLKRVDEQGFE
jgi:radical SAM protein with 4Fe4S-binding SPASM domain